MRTRNSIDLLRTTIRTPVLGAVLVLLLGLGCKSENPVATSGVPSGWTAKIGSSGGFTGGGAGYQVEANGKVTAWSRATAKADVAFNPVGTASESSLADLYSALTSEDLLATNSTETGNMTSFLEWSQGQESRRYSWIETNTPPDPVARAYQAVLAAVEEARSGASD